jgi:arylsulfatase
VRIGKWKGIRMDILKGNLKVRLYDLDNDIQEQNDIADEHPEIVKEIQQIMKKEHTRAAVDAFRMKTLDAH